MELKTRFFGCLTGEIAMIVLDTLELIVEVSQLHKVLLIIFVMTLPRHIVYFDMESVVANITNSPWELRFSPMTA
jgi:hypothetical protein